MTWCSHCDVNVGRQIYEQRPGECRQFYCLCRVSPQLGEEWRPTVSNMVLNYEPHIKRVNVSIDGPPDATWRREPYYSQIKAMALQMLRQQRHLVVWEGQDAIAVLPDKDLPLGRDETKVLIVRGRTTALGEEHDAVMLDADDPSLPAITRQTS